MPDRHSTLTPQKPRWFSVTNEAQGAFAEMMIYDRIGQDPYQEDNGIGAKDFNEALQAIPAGKPILVRINSPGGNVWDGIAIYNMLRAQPPGRVTTQVDGIAASSASLIALGGDKLRMPKAAMLMMHNPVDMCFGEAEDMRRSADKLDAHKEAIASIYTTNSNMTKQAVLDAMHAETWLNGEQCLACQMADELSEDEAAQNSFDLSRFRRVPPALKPTTTTTAPTNQIQGAPQTNIMNRDEMIALLQNWGVTVPQNSTDEWLKTELKKGKPAPQPAPVVLAAPAPQNVVDVVAAIQRQLEGERRSRITTVVNDLVTECRLTAGEAPAAIARATSDETYLTELRSRPQHLPGAPALDTALTVIAEDSRNILAGMRKHLSSGPQAYDNAVARGRAITAIYTAERARLQPVLNAAATNTIDAALKRVLILNETVRDFATRLLPLRLLSTVFSNVPLQGTDKIEVPYYPLQTATSSDFTDGDGTGGTGYQFGQATNTSKKEITVSSRKYQPLDYSSYEFRRQPWFDAVRLGRMNAEKLGVDVLKDILSVVTNANFGAAAKTVAAAAINSDDIIDLRGSANTAMWPDVGRALIVDSTVDTALQKDTAYKLALNIGTTSVIQDGKFPNLSGFDYAWMPNLPSNGESLIGFAAFASAILSAFAPIEPAPGVRAQLVAYEVVTDAATGIAFNYRHWGLAQADRDFEVIEVAYGYAAGVAAAIKRIVKP